MKPFDLSKLDFMKSNGLVTVITQDAITGTVLMVAHADQEALERTIATGEMHYTSRTRGLWHKGATSGNTQRVVSMTYDCDGDAVLARVIASGPACHTGTASCFEDADADFISRLDRIIASRATRTDDLDPSYTQRLLADRNARLKKIGEEAAELVLACSDGNRESAAFEGADLIYHMLVALRALGVSYADVQRVLAMRHKDSLERASI
ncbi:MAG TPA: bifunctional phosphoribosyl-AMP cyclohydrolase/phosphoribosyl-ATP diphosphatase HisIE [Gemmatimonadaceae bacterium]|nr:bifunctional phosphoribosyl-AMP cyclohydrolase/phosphoribosyl-ATP diphosphatase HisIE [Gemmatimonadaceae bacterium]